MKSRRTGGTGKQSGLPLVLNLIKTTPLSIVVHDPKGKIVAWSRGAEKLLGYSANEMVGTSFYNLLSSDAGVKEEKIVAKMSCGELGRCESRLVTKDGRILDVWTIVSPWCDVSGQVIAIFRFIEDISERKEIESKIMMSEKEKRLILDGIQELIAYQDLDNRVLWVNAAAARSVSQTSEELVGRFCYEIWHQRKAPCEGCPVVMARVTGRPQEAEIASPDGRFWHIRGYPVQDKSGQVSGVIEITSEITERKLAERERHEFEKRYRDIINGTSDVVLQIDLEGNFIYMNKSFETETGYSFEEIRGRNIKEFLVGESYQKAMERLEKRKKGEKSLPPFEVQVKAKDGRIIFFELNTSPIFKEKKLVAINIVARNITMRKEMEEMLRVSEEKYHSLIESSGDPIFLLDRELKFLYANKAFLARLGLSWDEVVGRSFADLYPAQAVERLSEAVNNILETGKLVQQEFWSEKLQGVFLRTISPVKNPMTDEITAFTVVSKDITALKTMEASLREYGEKLRAIVDFSPDGILITDLRHKIIDCNRAALKMLGITNRDELIGKDILDMISPETKNKMEGDIEETKKLGIKRDMRYGLMNGIEIPAEISISTIPDSTGKPQSLLFVIKDITERLRMEERMREFIYKVNNILPGDLCLHSSHRATYNIFTQLVMHGIAGLCFTREKPDELVNYGIPKDKIIVISTIPVQGYENVDGLQQVSLRISEFLKEHENSVVLLDGLEYLVSRSGFDLVYRFLQEKRFNFLESKSVMLIPVNLSVFTDKERALISAEANIIG
ncbi:MAG: PAS domain S-box protein [Candidatus Hadarchaeum sp.]|uniref:PAS domain S-box protein n=1 Tax=Candidatus Hadarchaeum sp. TaxID=2883567 RepID=UPI00317DE2EF